MGQAREQIQRNLALKGVADKLGLDTVTGTALTFVDSMTGALVRHELTWADVPSQYTLQDMMPGLAGKITHAIARRNAGFRLFEEVVDDPAKRTPLLRAYEECLRINPNATSLSVGEAFSALHLLKSRE